MKQRGDEYKDWYIRLGDYRYITRSIGQAFDEAIYAEPLQCKYYPDSLESDSDLYVAHQYIVKHYGENGALYV